MSDDIYDESQETYEDPYGDADKDETMPPLLEEQASAQPLHKRAPMPKPKVQVHKPTTREIVDAAVFKSDSLRKKYDLRNFMSEKK